MTEVTLPTKDCWYDLANAIVLNAVEEWRRSKFRLQFESLMSRYDDEVVRECEKFFRSKWFNILTDLDGNAFIKQLKKGFDFDD